MACRVFEEDEVSVIDGKILKCGLVLESSEFASSDEDEDNPYISKLKKGAIRVAWHPDGTEEELDEDKVKLLDRSLMPGDVVRRMIEGEDSQRGYVRTTHVNCHLQIIGTKKVLCNIDSKLLQPIMVIAVRNSSCGKFWDPEPGDVTLDSWVGKIECTNEQVFLSFPDGASCVVDDDEYLVELYEFEDLSDKREKDSEFFMKDYYPGQRLRGDLGLLEQAKWIKTTTTHSSAAAKKHPDKTVTVTVQKTEPKTIDVHWLCRGYAKADDPLEQMGAPPNSLGPKYITRLKKLDCFESCSVQIGDKDFYTVQENDIIVDLPQGKKNAIHYIIEKLKLNAENITTKDPNNANKKSKEDACKSIEAVSSDKVFSDATEERSENKTVTPVSPIKTVDGDDSDYEDSEDSASNAESTASAKSNTSNSSASKTKIIVKKTGTGVTSLQNKLMRKKKYKKQRRKVKKTPKQYKPGERVAVEIIYTFSTIDVMWQDGVIERNIPSVELYPIHHLDELEFFPGDFVIRNTELASIESSYGVVERVDHRGRCCLVRWMKPYQVGKANRPDQSIESEEVSVYDIKDHPDYKFRPGHVVVRVGGYEESHSEAAGQVYELSADGHLLIRWANGKMSHCWPQELFLIGDELSDMESLELTSSEDESDSDDSDASTSQSGGSWETEDEEETVAPDKAHGTKELTVEAEKKIELDQLLETARSTLQKLEDMFSQNVEINPYAVHCYREILHINRNCRELDSMLNASYFTDPSLAENVGAIKTELKKERSAKMTKQVQELFECNVRLSGMETDAPQPPFSSGKSATPTKESRQSESSQDGANSTENKCTQTTSSENNNCDNMGASDAPVQLSDTRDESKDNESNETESSKNLCKDVEGAAEAQIETDCNKNKANATEGGVESGNDSHDKKPSNTTTTGCTGGKETTGLVTGNRKAKDLCQTTCRLLKEQIMKVHEDLDRQWLVLREAGVILVKEEEEDEDETQTTHKKSPRVMPEEPSNKDAPATENAKPIEKSPSDKSLQGGISPRPKMELKLTSPTSTDASAATGAAAEPPTPQTPAEIREKIMYNKDGFKLLERCPLTHKFYSQEHQPTDIKSFLTAVKKELKMLNTSLPFGIYVKGFEDRMDLFSVMILGPARTPYEDGLFFFDVQLSSSYPSSPPSVHYISFCSDRLNPNLYEDGKVCVSLLGTWQGRGTEVWTSKSSLLQLLISIQGLILVSEPYYNEAGYEKQKGTQQGQENSRMYNEMAILKMVQSMMKMTVNPPSVFETEVKEHMNKCAHRMIRRLWFWLELSPSNKTPITSPSTSSTRLHSASASASAAPLTPSESQSASVLAASKESKQTEDLKAIGSSSAAVLETKSTEGKGSSLLQSDSVTDQSSCDSGISSDLTSGASSQEIAREDAADVVSGASNQRTAAIAHPLFPNTGNDAVSSSSEVNNQLTHSSQGAPASTTAVFWKPEFPLLPASRGFCLSMQKTLPQFTKVLESHGISQQSSW